MPSVSLTDLAHRNEHQLSIPRVAPSPSASARKSAGQLLPWAVRLLGVLVGISCMGTLCADAPTPMGESDDSVVADDPANVGDVKDEAAGDALLTSSTCSTATSVWQNLAITASNSMLSAEFDVMPINTAVDGLVALSKGSGTTFAQYAAIVRFSTQNTIDARDGGQYRALQSITYVARKTYHIRMVINVPTHTYSVYVTPPGAQEQTLAQDFRFRTEQQTVDTLNNRGIYAGFGGLQVCNFLATPIVLNQAPTAMATATPTTGNAPLAVMFDATASRDADGTIVRYAWNFGDGSTGVVGPVARVAHSYAVAGNYTATVTVTDNSGATGSTSATISAKDPCVTSSPTWQSFPIGSLPALINCECDVIPQAAGIDGLIGLSQGAASAYSSLATIVRFNTQNTIDARNGGTYAAAAALSYTPGVKYHVRTTINVPTHSYDVYVTPDGGQEQQIAAGYAFRSEQQAVGMLDTWSANSSIGALQVCRLQATALTSLQLPTAVATATPTTGNAPLTVQFDASASRDIDGMIIDYAWDFGDGSTGTGRQPVHVYTALGDYSATLTVTDNAGATGSTSATISVMAGAPPTLAASTNSMSFGPTTSNLAFDVWNSGGSTLTYSVADNADWLTVTPASGSSSGQLITHTATVDDTGLACGTYQGTITVTPNAGTAWVIAVAMQVACAPPTNVVKPIARWDVVPYQRINRGSTLNCGVVAFSKNGIARVRFTINGQGYSGPSPVDVTQMTLNDQTGVYEYWTPINGNNFSGNGPFTVEATVYGSDGGVRDKTTDGGGVGLDQLPLVANGTGTLAQPEAWVSPSAGNDSTGTVNNSAKPFATVGRAIDSIRLYRSGQGLGNNADGGIVRLMPGSHTCSAGGVSAAIACSNEWVTITTAAGGTRANTILLPGGIVSTRKIRVSGITLSGGGTLGMSSTERSQAMVWADNCTIIGSGRTVAGAHPLSSEYGALYYTGCSITQVQQATSGSRLCRGLTITTISDDAFQNVPLVINCNVDDIDPLSSGAHADLFQHGGGNAGNHIDDNTIVYNLKGTRLAYQGIFVNGDPYTVPTKAKGMAFVNVFIQMNSNSHDNCMWYRWVDHLIWWHCTIRRNDADPRGMQIYTASVNGVKYPPQISNFSVVGCDFERLIGADTAVIDMTGWRNNHFISTVWGGQAVGTDATTGADSLDANGVPLAGSRLCGRVAPLVVPVDVRNKLRPSSSDAGAFQR